MLPFEVLFDGRVALLLPELAFEVFEVFDVFVGAIVAAGVGLAMLVFVRFVLVLFVALFVAASPQATPSAPSAKTAVSAIFFIMLDYSPVFFKVKIICLTAGSRWAAIAPIDLVFGTNATINSRSPRSQP